MRKTRIRLVLGDGHRLSLTGLEAIFTRERDLRVVATCLRGDEVFAAVRTHRPDILVVDFRMPGIGELGALKPIVREPSAPRLVLLTDNVDDDDTVEAVRLGVRGILPKDMPPRVMVDCVRRVHAGETWFERQSTGRALATLLKRQAALRELAGVVTARETEILRLTARGLSSAQIATQLAISPHTVKTHLHRVYKKVGVSGRPALILFAQKHALL
jgi:DNA-binding NarL/FixJ family response regulator